MIFLFLIVLIYFYWVYLFMSLFWVFFFFCMVLSISRFVAASFRASTFSRAFTRLFLMLCF